MGFIQICSVIDRAEKQGYHRRWKEYRVFGIKIYTTNKSKLIKDY